MQVCSFLNCDEAEPLNSRLKQPFLKRRLISSGWPAFFWNWDVYGRGHNKMEKRARSWQLPIWSLARVWRKRERAEREVNLKNNKYTGGELSYCSCQNEAGASLQITSQAFSRCPQLCFLLVLSEGERRCSPPPVTIQVSSYMCIRILQNGDFKAGNREIQGLNCYLVCRTATMSQLIN